MRRVMALLLILMLILPAGALAQWWDVIPTPAGTADSLSDQEILAALRATPTPKPTAEPREPFTLLLVGLDTYDPNGTGRSDTMVLARLDPQRGSIRMISFLRDLYVSIPRHGFNRLNAAYVFGGPERLMETLEANFGVKADAYVAVNFSLMADLVDQLGGITLDVTEKEMRQVNSILEYYNQQMGDKPSDQLLRQYGRVNLTGKQALCYSRIRKIDSDFQRTARQRKVLEAIFDKACSIDPLSLSGLVMKNISQVSTNLTLTQATQLIPLALSARHASFEALTIPAQGAYQSTTRRGMSVLEPDLAKNRQLIRDFWGE